jgi:hypothetical protein
MGRGELVVSTTESPEGETMKALFGIVLASALTLPAAEAMANVVYALQERFAAVPEFEGTLTFPDFISADTKFPIADFSVSNNSFRITQVEFAPDSSSFECSNSHLSRCDLLTTTNATRMIPFGFPVGTFSKTGDNAQTFLASSAWS